MLPAENAHRMSVIVMVRYIIRRRCKCRERAESANLVAAYKDPRRSRSGRELSFSSVHETKIFKATELYGAVGASNFQGRVMDRHFASLETLAHCFSGFPGSRLIAKKLDFEVTSRFRLEFATVLACNSSRAAGVSKPDNTIFYCVLRLLKSLSQPS